MPQVLEHYYQKRHAGGTPQLFNGQKLMDSKTDKVT
jgi:hypothetical protein